MRLLSLQRAICLLLLLYLITLHTQINSGNFTSNLIAKKLKTHFTYDIMSSQPSTSEKIKQTTNSALDSVSSTASAADPNYDPNKDRHNFAKDDLGNKFKKGDYKDQLNQAAHGGPKTEEEKPQGYLEKVASYIPGISSLQQHAYEQGPEEDTSSKTPPGPPNRPDHDVQVEEFLRKQYSSSSGTGIPEPKGSS